MMMSPPVSMCKVIPSLMCVLALAEVLAHGRQTLTKQASRDYGPSCIKIEAPSNKTEKITPSGHTQILEALLTRPKQIPPYMEHEGQMRAHICQVTGLQIHGYTYRRAYPYIVIFKIIKTHLR